MQNKITSFPAIVDNTTEILILGTMPGVTSLQKGEYYGYAQNQFWKIMYTILDKLPVADKYAEKIELLKHHKVGLWDVLAACERKGSLDSNIKNQLANDIPGVLIKFPNITRILFNGKDSHKYFIRAFGAIDRVELHVLPSTSPANTMRFVQKLELWRVALL